MGSGLKYYTNLDGLRGIAALSVVVFHFFSFPISKGHAITDAISSIHEVGSIRVSLFFVLSGFVITRILINSKGADNYFSGFYIRRVLRIAPLYYLFLLTWYYLLPAFTGQDMVAFRDQAVYYLYLQNIVPVAGPESNSPGHLWSLAIEEHFYLVWPVLVYLVPVKNLPRLIFGLIAAGIALRFFMLQDGLTINKFTLTRMDQILLGSYLGLQEMNRKLDEPSAAKRFALLGLCTLALAAVVYWVSGYWPLVRELLKYTLMGVLFYSLVGYLLSISEEARVNKMLSSKLCRYFGRISYGIYIWHVLVLHVLYRLADVRNLWVNFALTLALTIAIAHISFFYYELLFLKWKKKLVAKPAVAEELVPVQGPV